jgi:hypothetical protein
MPRQPSRAVNRRDGARGPELATSVRGCAGSGKSGESPSTIRRGADGLAAASTRSSLSARNLLNQVYLISASPALFAHNGADPRIAVVELQARLQGIDA